MAVPAPSSTAATAQVANVVPRATRPIAVACTSMPVAMSHLRPIWSESAPVASCPAPQTAGYRAASTPDLGHRQAVACEQDGEHSPREPVVEVVDHARLAGRGQGAFPEAGEPRDLAGAQVLSQAPGRPWMAGRLVAGVTAGFPDSGR